MSRVVLFLLLLFTGPAWAQTHRYMVFFNDKAGTPHSISNPSTFLSAKAVQRRQKGLSPPINEADLPVVPGYVTQVRSTGAKAFFTTRWMNGVLVEANPTQLAAIQLLACVSSTEYVAPNHKLLGGRKKGVTGTSTNPLPTLNQLTMLGIDSMHADGFRGEGIRVAVLDSGFPGVDANAMFQALRDDGRIVMTQDFITNSADVYQFDEHGTNVLSIMAAAGPGYIGGAPAAEYLLFVTEDASTEYRVEEYNWLFAAEQADSAGADIIQSSVGYSDFDDPSMNYTTAQMDGQTTVVSRAASMASARAIVVVASAGNLGNTPWQTVSAPADGPLVLSVGAITSSGNRAVFSSYGVLSSGYIKPDVVALGVGVTVVNAAGSLMAVDGTSAAAPLVSSLMAGLLQKYPQQVPYLLRSDLATSASNYPNVDPETGYGVPGYLAVRNYVERKVGPVVYPNPAGNTLWYTHGQMAGAEIVSITIVDMAGRTIMGLDNPNVTWNNSTAPIDVSGLSPGLYILRVVVQTGKAFAFRFVKL